MYRFARPGKRRPVLVLSHPAALAKLHSAIVAPITTSIRELPSEVRVGVADGLQEECVVNLDHIATIAKSELQVYVGYLDELRMRAVCDAAEIALGCR